MPLRFLFILGLLLIAEYYSLVVVRSLLRSLPQFWRISLLVLYILASLAAWLGIIFFRAIDWSRLPHLARNIYIAFALGLSIGKLLVLVVMLVDDLRRLVLWVINLFYTGGTKAPDLSATHAPQGITRSLFLTRLAAGLGGLSLTGFLYGISNRYDYRMHRLTLQLPKLPLSMKGLKILQISDIHSGSFDNQEAVLRGVQKGMAEAPDLIVFTGDLVNNHSEEILPYLDIFSQLRAPMGVYSTLGNHDYGDYVPWPSPEAKAANLERLKSYHARMGWKMLNNEHVVFTHPDGSLALLGVENWSAKPQFPKHGDLAAASRGLPEDVAVQILLSHDPSHWDAQVRPDYPGIDLMLAGHTHGMQFGVEIPGFKWSPVQYVYKKWADLYQEGHQYLYVNRGYGFLGYPGRLGIMPELTLITLV
ncbi:MAG: metallophosphoesterase [Bacteroidetes bacterium]|nr:metallophosphoesterase [Bacteroidota bacterium]